VSKEGGLKDSAALFDKLARPVQITNEDVNKDGRDDYIVCEFGISREIRSWMEKFG